MTDLIDEGDGKWLFDYPQADAPLPALGQPSVSGSGNKVAIISYGNGVYLSHQAREHLQADDQLRIIDLRYLIPLDMPQVMAAVGDCEHILIVDECRQRGSLSEEIMTYLLEHDSANRPVSRITADDSFIPLGRAAYDVLPSASAIAEKLKALGVVPA